MKVLIVEDDENKRSQIIDFVKQISFVETVEIAGSYQSGLRKIIGNAFDLILLDMTMPTFDVSVEEEGGRTQVYGGRALLRQMDRRSILIPVIVVTQFDRFGESRNVLTLEQLHGELRRDYPKTYRGTVYYNAALELWKRQLNEKLVSVQQEMIGKPL